MASRPAGQSPQIHTPDDLSKSQAGRFAATRHQFAGILQISRISILSGIPRNA
jgi:hypothetical protein